MIRFNPSRYAQVTAFIGRRLSRVTIVSMLVSLLIAVYCPDNLEAGQQLPADLTELSLEELMDLEVTSVAKKSQKLSDAAAAVFVITGEDIRRSGVTSIAEALRLAPGMQVARVDANKWAITVRGFNGRFVDKLLVLIDGRSVYTPLFSGVFWDVQDTLLADVERIEVIRGPGSTMWGANAINGVINIITKNAGDTQGGLVTAGGGAEERSYGSVRYGGKLSENAYYRAYAKYFSRDGFVDASGNDAADDWNMARGGYRMDWQPSNRDSFTLQGDIYDGSIGQTINEPSLTKPFTRTINGDVDAAGGNILTRWKGIFSKYSQVGLQLYYDRTERTELVGAEFRDTFDVDFQHQFALGKRQEIVWGLGYRFTRDEIDGTFIFSTDPDSRSNNLFSAFVQDELGLFPDRLYLTLGSKFEHNDYTGVEIQPNGRLIWTPTERHTSWAAMSRAIRTPSRVDNDAWLNDSVILAGFLFPSLPTELKSTPTLISISGRRDIESEELVAYELGSRVQPVNHLFLDIAVFYHVYDNLMTAEVDEQAPGFRPAEPSHYVANYIVANKMQGETYGVELAIDWRRLDWWRLKAAYSYLEIQLRIDEDSEDYITEQMYEGADPNHRLSLFSSLALRKYLELDLWLRYVDNLPSLATDSYITMDARLGWKPRNDLEVSIVGQNLLDNYHPEFKTDMAIEGIPTQVERGIYGKITWRF